MTSTVRPGVPADAEAVETVRITSWKTAYRGILASDLLDGLTVTEERVRWWTEAIGTGEVSVRVAETSGEVHGFCSYGASRDADIPGAEIYAIYLLPARFSTGMGGRLMAEALDDLRDRGEREVGLWVLEDNARARRFYERCGFEPTGRRNLWRDEVPEVHYRLALTKVSPAGAR
ncbi:GNAT family N-acetyltransferase [Nonomuraea sp. NPDC050328]|uniref:GNAT family N-acetyltransferase n=1 Tax=Nonomuraea sp. NPDC050328 TaxID=3364361 RepID=UPI0037B5D69C